ncbi:hypothetical protein C8J57DRAFT_1465036 [Mycena rebaudengoi]|nr:hypothetical protein C8J57DRAFT_1465036 [Mycena rebaudengoi]
MPGTATELVLYLLSRQNAVPCSPTATAYQELRTSAPCRADSLITPHALSLPLHHVRSALSYASKAGPDVLACNEPRRSYAHVSTPCATARPATLPPPEVTACLPLARPCESFSFWLVPDSRTAVTALKICPSYHHHPWTTKPTLSLTDRPMRTNLQRASFRRLPIGDVDLRAEIYLEDHSSIGDNAEIYGTASSSGIHAAVFHDGL